MAASPPIDGPAPTDTLNEALVVCADVFVVEDVVNAVRAAEESYGGLGVAFNYAGIPGFTAPVANRTVESWRADIDGILTSTFVSMRHEIPAILRRGGGAIINNASVLNLVGSSGGVSSYVAGKHGVLGLTRAAALELAPHNLRVNAIALSSVDTPMFHAVITPNPETEETFRAAHPLGRVAQPEEAASLVAYLAGDDASFTTGAILNMDGGWTTK